MNYETFIETKRRSATSTGLTLIPDLLPELFPFQAAIVAWALRKGRAAIFADCGLGKTIMQLEWARHVPGAVLILAPLAVAEQTVAEGARFGIDLAFSRDGCTDGRKITITNYEMLHHFDPGAFNAVVLDESSILKSYEGKTRNQILEFFGKTPFKLACTATPSPNDFMELGNHSEFLGVLSRTEMLSTFFVHDGGETQKWRLKGHAEVDFWKWICSWAVNVRRPSDLGFSDKGFILPRLHIRESKVKATKTLEGFLFPMEASTLGERTQARRETSDDRAKAAAELIASKPNEQWLIWCNLNVEADLLKKHFPNAVEIRGSDTIERKSKIMLGFSSGEVRVLVTKPSIAGFGMNWQNCHNIIFLGLSDSYEQFYQAIRRCWRFGQKLPVDAHIITADIEGAVVRNISRKEDDAKQLAEEMVNHMSEITKTEITGTVRTELAYKRDVRTGKNWTLYLSDCIDLLAETKTDSLDYSIFSPPFSSLYTYSSSERDLGNCTDDDTFMKHFDFVVKDLYRAIKPGRLVSFHCMNLPTSKTHHGYIGIRDFRGDLIRMFQEAGFIYHSEVCIWKDPVTAMQRTKALGLLHKQLKKNSCMSRQGIPDYLVTMRKPGVNPDPVTHTNESFPVGVWQKYASPIWMDINPSDTLQFRSAREHKDEKHI